MVRSPSSREKEDLDQRVLLEKEEGIPLRDAEAVGSDMPAGWLSRVGATRAACVGQERGKTHSAEAAGFIEAASDIRKSDPAAMAQKTDSGTKRGAKHEGSLEGLRPKIGGELCGERDSEGPKTEEAEGLGSGPARNDVSSWEVPSSRKLIRVVIPQDKLVERGEEGKKIGVDGIKDGPEKRLVLNLLSILSFYSGLSEEATECPVAGGGRQRRDTLDLELAEQKSFSLEGGKLLLPREATNHQLVALVLHLGEIAERKSEACPQEELIAGLLEPICSRLNAVIKTKDTELLDLYNGWSREARSAWSAEVEGRYSGSRSQKAAIMGQEITTSNDSRSAIYDGEFWSLRLSGESSKGGFQERFGFWQRPREGVDDTA